MIAHIAGTVSDKRVDSIVVDVNGIGYEVNVGPKDLDQINSGEQVTLHTYFAVRENAQELYGFTSAAAILIFLSQIGHLTGIKLGTSRKGVGIVSLSNLRDS